MEWFRVRSGKILSVILDHVANQLFKLLKCVLHHIYVVSEHFIKKFSVIYAANKVVTLEQRNAI